MNSNIFLNTILDKFRRRIIIFSAGGIALLVQDVAAGERQLNKETNLGIFNSLSIINSIF